VYAEISIRFERIEELEDALPTRDFVRLPLPWEAAFLAGKCFVRYRRRSGRRRSPLPDFYIGAHAAVAGPSGACWLKSHNFGRITSCPVRSAFSSRRLHAAY
jgi:hypothetical protein